MSADEFVFLLVDNIPLYLLGLLLSIVVLLPVFKITYKGVLDPLFYAIVMAALANAVPFFLILTGKISFSSFIYIFISEAAFWIGFLIYNKKVTTFRNFTVVENEKKDFLLFVFYFVFLVVIKLLAYILVGVPIFYEEGRLAVFTESGGLGILDRLSTFPIFFISFYSFKLIDSGSVYKKFAIVALISVVLFSFLSGSKAAVLVIVGGYFYFNYFYKSSFVNFKKFLKYIPLLLILPVVILALDATGTGFSPLVGLVFRFIANGDIYFMSFPNDVIDKIDISNKFIYFFSGLLAPLRLIDIKSVDTVIGYQLNWDLHPFADGSLGGPNSRIPVIGWVFFRWGGIIFSFILGYLMSLFYNKLSRIFSKGIINFMLIAYIQYNILVFITDPVLGIGYLFDIAVSMFLFFIFYFLIHKKITIVEDDLS